MPEIGEQPAIDPSQTLTKRKPEPESAATEVGVVETKKQRPDTVASASAADDGVVGGEENGRAVLDKGKNVLMEKDKGKGKAVVVEEDNDEEDDDSDSDDDDSEDESDDGIGELEEEDSDFVDDPLAEVDLENVLPSRTRRRAPPPPGSYLVNDIDGEEDEDDDEDDEGFD